MEEYFQSLSERHAAQDRAGSNDLDEDGYSAGRGSFSTGGNVSGGYSGRGHHISHFLPANELNRFMRKARGGGGGGEDSSTAVDDDPNKLTDSNVGHKMLQRMGWTEGSGLGKQRSGRTDIVQAGDARVGSNAGVGAATAASMVEPSAADDEFESYKKRMALSYRHRPNPLNNPRKAYY